MPFDIARFRRLSLAFDPISRDRSMSGPQKYHVREAHQDFRKALKAQLQLGDDAKLLLAGQPGCGKTTLLVDLASELRAEGRLVVFLDMELLTAVQDLGPSEMHLAVLAGMLEEAQRSDRAPSAAMVERCQRGLQPLIGVDEKPQGAAGLARRILRLLTELRQSPAQRSELRQQVTRGGDGDPYELVSQLLTELAAARPILILDGLDKLPPDQARIFFLQESRKPMADASCSAILTIPLSVVHEPTYNVLSERYRNAENAVLPALRLNSMIPTEDGSVRQEPFPAGLALLRRIVDERLKQAQVDDGLVEAEAIDLVIQSSGGNLRELARLMQASIVKAVTRESPHITRSHVEDAIADQRESFGRVYEDRFLPVLRRVRDEFDLDNGEIGKLLLYGLWVVEYRNGRVWYDLPLPVRRLLERRERRKA